MKCPDCGQEVGAPEWKARVNIRWANQYGRKTRIFCDACGAWNDITQHEGKPDVIKQLHPPGKRQVPTPYGSRWEY